jgi:hypothetical protein
MLDIRVQPIGKDLNGFERGFNKTQQKFHH